jgi:hypothetical protein
MCGARSQPIIDHMLMTGLATTDAERAFTRAMRARRWAALKRLLGRGGAGRLPVHDRPPVAAVTVGGVREIPLDCITGTLEPARARLFDRSFRPARAARTRWQRVWLAEQRGVPLPPIEVVPVEGGFVVRDGHHRVSVARARGGQLIDATVGAA